MLAVLKAAVAWAERTARWATRHSNGRSRSPAYHTHIRISFRHSLACSTLRQARRSQGKHPQHDSLASIQHPRLGSEEAAAVAAAASKAVGKAAWTAAA